MVNSLEMDATRKTVDGVTISAVRHVRVTDSSGESDPVAVEPTDGGTLRVALPQEGVDDGAKALRQRIHPGTLLIG